MAKKSKQDQDAAKYPGEAMKLKRERTSENAKMGDMARRSMKKGKLNKGSHRRVP